MDKLMLGSMAVGRRTGSLARSCICGKSRSWSGRWGRSRSWGRSMSVSGRRVMSVSRVMGVSNDWGRSV